MSGTIHAVNRSNGKPAKFTKEQWDKVQSDPDWKHVFKEVTKPEAPKEVKELEAKQAQPKAETAERKPVATDTKKAEPQGKAKGK